MKYLVSLLIILIILLAWYIPTCDTLAHDQATSEFFIAISPVEVSRMVKTYEAVLVDVREEVEIQSGIADHAQWMPLSRMKENDPMFAVFLNGLPKQKLIVFYCVGGKRARQAQIEMEKRGYHTANMGGLAEWVRAGFPTQKWDRQK